jgi:hypothetical protein
MERESPVINWQTTDADACTSLPMTLQVKSPKNNFKTYYLNSLLGKNIFLR